MSARPSGPNVTHGSLARVASATGPPAQALIGAARGGVHVFPPSVERVHWMTEPRPLNVCHTASRRSASRGSDATNASLSLYRATSPWPFDRQCCTGASDCASTLRRTGAAEREPAVPAVALGVGLPEPQLVQRTSAAAGSARQSC